VFKGKCVVTGVAALCLFVTLGTWAASSRTRSGTSDQAEHYVLVGAGDVAGCDDLSGAKQTSALLAKIPGTVFVDGDLVYPDGSLSEFTKCYGPTWGRVKQRTRPALGNHEYQTKNAAGYFQYFGSAAGPDGKGYYSYDRGSWHIIVLNSDCSDVPGGCGTGSPQERWLRKDLRDHPALCSLAYFHHPLFSSSEVGDDSEVKPLWEDLYRAGMDLVINGHAHDYERFAPQDPNGHPDAKRGIREIIAGTGGKDHAHFVRIDSNSLIRNNDTFGVLKVTLSPGGYTWKFIPVAGATFTDSGSDVCHK